MGVSPSTFTVTGSGFTPGGSVAIDILNSGKSNVGTVYETADSSGNLNGSSGFSITSVDLEPITSPSAGTYYGYIQCYDQSSGIYSNQVQVAVTVQIVNPAVSVTPSPFNITSNTSLTYTGTGFSANSTISIYLNSNEVNNAKLGVQPQSDVNGNWSLTITFPGSGVTDNAISMAEIGEAIKVTATDSSNNSATTTFTVTETITAPAAPSPPFYMGTGASDGTHTTNVFGAPLNSPVVDFTSMPYILGATTIFDFSTLTSPCEAVAALYTMSNFSAATTITMQWVRERDGKVLFTYTYNVPSAASQEYSYWAWYDSMSWIGYDSWEIGENGYYHVVITNSTTGENATIRFAVVGISSPIG
jgi:hypothetical protein